MSSGRGFRHLPAVIWFRRWRFPIFVALLAVFVGPGAVSDLRSSPSAWDWIGFGCLVILVIGLPLFVLDALRNDRHAPPPRLDPSHVADSAVHQAVSASDDRIAAIRALREAHPGLGLRDAAELVDMHRDH